MTGHRPRPGAARLVALVIILLLCIWLLYRMFVAIPSAPPPKIKVAGHTMYAKGDIWRWADTGSRLASLPTGRTCGI